MCSCRNGDYSVADRIKLISDCRAPSGNSRLNKVLNADVLLCSAGVHYLLMQSLAIAHVQVVASCAMQHQQSAE
jgi:hypothetical protein